MPFVVEQRRDGAVARVYVATEERAKEIVAASPCERAWREISYDDMPEKARVAMQKAQSEEQQ